MSKPELDREAMRRDAEAADVSALADDDEREALNRCPDHVDVLLDALADAEAQRDAAIRRCERAERRFEIVAELFRTNSHYSLYGPEEGPQKVLDYIEQIESRRATLPGGVGAGGAENQREG